VKDNGGPVPVQPSDSEYLRHHRSSQNQGGKEDQEHQINQSTKTEASSYIDGSDHYGQQDDDYDNVINQEDQPADSGSSISNDPKQKPLEDITTPPPSTRDGTDLNG